MGKASLMLRKVVNINEDLICHHLVLLLAHHINETLTYYCHRQLRMSWNPTSNSLERIMRVMRRRTSVIGAFPDNHSALILVADQLRHNAGTNRVTRQYLSMDALHMPNLEYQLTTCASRHLKCEGILTLPVRSNEALHLQGQNHLMD